MTELQTPYVKLSKTEAKKLNALLRERHGNLKACSDLTGLHVNTLKRAKDELEITPENAAIIREKLLTTV